MNLLNVTKCYVVFIINNNDVTIISYNHAKKMFNKLIVPQII